MTATATATPTIAARAARSSESVRVRSKLAGRLFEDLMALDPVVRGGFVRGLGERDMAQLLRVADHEGGTPYVLWADDPCGFVELVLGETTWSKQREVLASVPTYTRTFVPASHGVGKTHLAARVAAWAVVTTPPGTALTVTTAPRMRQVTHLIWPHIRSAVNAAGLPGEVGVAQWKIADKRGLEHRVAYGFSAPDHDESAVQGIHAAGRLVCIVDEAGGIARLIGDAMYGMLTGDDAHMLAIGNPATDDEDTWFEEICTSGEPDVNVVRISALGSPNLTGEKLGPCRACPPEKGLHTPGKHLVKPAWVDEAIRSQGEDSAYVVARVHAQFPHGVTEKAIPYSWVELALEVDEPDGEGYVRLDSLGLNTERDPWKVKRGAWVRLGVDVAADGGDELVIARCVGDLITVRHHSSGPANAESAHVAGKVLEEILAAEALAKALGSDARITVKIDANGLGWGTAGTLKAWASELVHGAAINAVKVSENPAFPAEGASMRPHRKRDEMWLAGRDRLTPGPGRTPGSLRLRVDGRTAKQLAAPNKTTNSSGFTVIESKESMRKRGIDSPDRAEGVLLAIYEPPLIEYGARLIV